MPTITPFLWFNNNAEDAMTFYASVFPRTKVHSVQRAHGKVVSVEFEIEGQRFMGLNGGPDFPFTEAVSFLVACETQAEIDQLWSALTSGGGTPGRCGWLKDKFGLSWQVIPKNLGALLTGGGDAGRAQRVTHAMLQMNKLDLNALQDAYDRE